MKPLNKIRILDLTRLLPGAICSVMLADMGADVVKIESPDGGDYARWMPPMSDGLGAFFRSSNRGKRSMILDLKQEEGQQVLHQLAGSADVLIESFRPGVTARLGCDYETIRQVNPQIVFCSLSGWGQTGPYALLSGHDLNYVSLNGVQGANGAAQTPGAQIADVSGAYAGVIGIMAGLLQRQNGGEGNYVDIALSESAMPFMWYSWLESRMLGVAGGEGALTGGLACYHVYSAKDQPVALAALEMKFWANFCHVLNHPEWIDWHTDPAKQGELKDCLNVLFASKNADEWVELLGDADCCFTKVTPLDELMDDPQLQSRQMLGVLDGVPWMRNPVRMKGDEVEINPAPGYGEHTEEILGEYGFQPEVIAELIVRKVVVQG